MIENARTKVLWAVIVLAVLVVLLAVLSLALLLRTPPVSE